MDMKPLILIVEDEAALATMLRYNLGKKERGIASARLATVKKP